MLTGLHMPGSPAAAVSSEGSCPRKCCARLHAQADGRGEGARAKSGREGKDDAEGAARKRARGGEDDGRRGDKAPRLEDRNVSARGAPRCEPDQGLGFLGSRILAFGEREGRHEARRASARAAARTTAAGAIRHRGARTVMPPRAVRRAAS